jgi:hypothetical protein
VTRSGGPPVLGALLVGQGRLEEARTLFNQTLAAREEGNGIDYYEVAVVLNHLACLDRDIDPAGAMASYSRAFCQQRWS